MRLLLPVDFVPGRPAITAWSENDVDELVLAADGKLCLKHVFRPQYRDYGRHLNPICVGIVCRHRRLDKHPEVAEIGLRICERNE